LVLLVLVLAIVPLLALEVFEFVMLPLLALEVFEFVPLPEQKPYLSLKKERLRKIGI
jgi:hypothetical protein